MRALIGGMAMTFGLWLLPLGAMAQSATVTFDAPAPAGSSDSLISGTYQGLTFGSGQWRWSGPYAAASTNSVYFASSSGTTRTLGFAAGPRILTQLVVYTATNGTLTLSDGVNPAVTRSVTTGSLQTVNTGWTQASTTITVGFSAGWALGIDALTHGGAVASGSDTTPPMVSLTAPAPETTVNGVTALTASAFDAGGVAGVQFRLNGANLGAEDTTAPYSLSWDTRAVANGSNALTAVARDAAGNRTTATAVTVTVNNPVSSTGAALQFFGNGRSDIDRVKIRVDDPATAAAGPPADIGATDFTIEFWMKTTTAGPSVQCGSYTWIQGRTVIDRDRYNQDRAFGVSVAGGRIMFGVAGAGSGRHTVCGTRTVSDGQWHHIAVQRRRSDGWMWLYVDGVLDAQANGPDGDISYPDNGVPGAYCGSTGRQACTGSDPFLVVGAEKHDVSATAYPSYIGVLDELRLSRVLRYSGSPVARPAGPFVADAQTVALYHFDEGQGDIVNDSSGASGGPSQGVRRVGGSPTGPAWVSQTPF